MPRSYGHLIGGALAVFCGVLCARYGKIGLAPGGIALLLSIIPLRRAASRQLAALHSILPMLRKVILDVIPENRSVSPDEILDRLAARVAGGTAVDPQLFTELRAAIRDAIPAGVRALRAEGALRVDWLHPAASAPPSPARREGRNLIAYALMMAGTCFVFLPIFNPPNLDANGNPVADPTPIIVGGVLIALFGLGVLVRSTRREPPN